MKAAILVKSKQPLVVEDISFPKSLEFGQVLVDVHYSGICVPRSIRLMQQRDQINFYRTY